MELEPRRPLSISQYHELELNRRNAAIVNIAKSSPKFTALRARYATSASTARPGFVSKLVNSAQEELRQFQEDPGNHLTGRAVDTVLSFVPLPLPNAVGDELKQMVYPNYHKPLDQTKRNYMMRIAVGSTHTNSRPFSFGSTAGFSWRPSAPSSTVQNNPLRSSLPTSTVYHSPGLPGFKPQAQSPGIPFAARNASLIGRAVRIRRPFPVYH
jgi:hypothetical protein